MRDYYDVYLIYTRDWKNINKDHFRKTIDKTFAKREYTGNPLETLEVIKNSKSLKQRWDIYNNKYEYSKGVAFEETIRCIEIIINEVIPVEV